jgi:hypothetical protein
LDSSGAPRVLVVQAARISLDGGFAPTFGAAARSKEYLKVGRRRIFAFPVKP